MERPGRVDIDPERRQRRENEQKPTKLSRNERWPVSRAYRHEPAGTVIDRAGSSCHGRKTGRASANGQACRGPAPTTAHGAITPALAGPEQTGLRNRRCVNQTGYQNGLCCRRLPPLLQNRSTDFQQIGELPSTFCGCLQYFSRKCTLPTFRVRGKWFGKILGGKLLCPQRKSVL